MLETKDISRGRTRAGAVLLAALAAGTVLVGVPRTAHADEVKPDAKGIVGGAFLGAEVVVFTEALFGVRSGVAYGVGALAGAAAGGVGGYFIEQEAKDGQVPAYMLAGGLALVIPALVVALDQTRYLPNTGAREDKSVRGLPPSDPGQPGGSTVIGAEPPPPASTMPPPTSTPSGNPPSGTTPLPPTTPPPAGGGGTPQGPQSLFNVQESGFRVGVPVPEVRPLLSAADRKAMGAQSAGSELRFPVVRVTF